MREGRALSTIISNKHSHTEQLFMVNAGCIPKDPISSYLNSVVVPSDSHMQIDKWLILGLGCIRDMSH